MPLLRGDRRSEPTISMPCTVSVTRWARAMRAPWRTSSHMLPRGESPRAGAVAAERGARAPGIGIPQNIFFGLLRGRSSRANDQAMEGSVGIVMGTRSAVFTPLANPGIIIVDEEHDTSYKQQDGFRYSARDLAVLRGQFEACSVVLGSATPSLESLHNVEIKKYQLLSLTRRPAPVKQEKYELIDTRHLEKISGFTRVLKEKITEQLNSGHQVLVFLNRRGFAPVIMCSTCNWIAQCRRCDARLTYHLTSWPLVSVPRE